ncbi:MAG: DUF3179 domain-containing protein, partial [Chloroflexi bacterium]|nr:DUF3179 domain-containing protein [Chloroflexota bacterium]
MKNKHIIPLIGLGLLAIAGTVAGLGLAGAFGSDDAPTPARASASNRAATPAPATATLAPATATPAPATATTTHPVRASGPEELPAVVIVEPDPDYENALRSARISQRGWLTDFSLHSVPYDEILSGGPPRDGIPPIDNPKFTTPAGASEWLGDLEPVIAFELNGDARAYPLQILTWHEIV